MNIVQPDGGSSKYYEPFDIFKAFLIRIVGKYPVGIM